MNVNEDKIDSMIDTYRIYYEILKDEITLYPFYDPPLIPTGSIPHLLRHQSGYSYRN